MPGYVVPDQHGTAGYLLAVYRVCLDHDAMRPHTFSAESLGPDRQVSVGCDNVARLHLSVSRFASRVSFSSLP